MEMGNSSTFKVPKLWSNSWFSKKDSMKNVALVMYGILDRSWSKIACN